MPQKSDRTEEFLWGWWDRWCGAGGIFRKNAGVFQWLWKAFLVDDITLIITPCPGDVLRLLLSPSFTWFLCCFLVTRTQEPVPVQHKARAAGGTPDPPGSAELAVLHDCTHERNSSSVKNKTGKLETHQILPLAHCYCPRCMQQNPGALIPPTPGSYHIPQPVLCEK